MPWGLTLRFGKGGKWGLEWGWVVFREEQGFFYIQGSDGIEFFDQVGSEYI
jgi:hypothetical protein